MADFRRTVVDGVSVSRMIIGTNWFLGYSHHSAAKNKFIREFQTIERVAEGYDGYVGLEYRPLKEPAESLRDTLAVVQ